MLVGILIVHAVALLWVFRSPADSVAWEVDA